MKSIKIAVISIAYIGIAFTGFALDLTPIPDYRELEGVKIPVVRFRDGQDSVIWSAPWPISGGGKRIRLSVSETAQAGMTLLIQDPKVSEVPPDIAPSPEILQQWGAQFFPADATEIVPVATTRSAYQLRLQPSKEFTFTYLSGARRFTSAVSYVDLNPDERLIVIVTAPSKEFKAIHETAIQSLFRMEWLGK